MGGLNNMELKRCVRCGKFYASDVEVCQDCEKKDFADLSKLKGFFADNYVSGVSRMEISASTGISARNLNRYLGYEEFAGIYIPETGANELGEELAKKYKEDPVVINSIKSHHGDEPANSIIAELVQIADTLSAARPGARNDSLENYIKRLEQLEEIGNSFEGVDKTFAMQAGREVRVMVKPEEIDDTQSYKIAREMKEKIERAVQIFKAISALAGKHHPIDIYTVAQELNKTGDLEEVGGPVYLSQLSLRIGAAAHLDFHTKVLLQKYIQREMISISYDVQKKSYDDTITVDDLLDTTQQKLFNLAEKNMKKETQSVKDILNEAIDDLRSVQNRQDGLSGVPSGYTGIDRVTYGWQASDLIIIAARPAMGKTAFVLTMARNMTVDHNVPVAVFSLEMSSVQLVKRLMVSETGLSAEKIRGGKKLEEYEWAQLDSKLNQLSEAPLYIDDPPSLSIFEFRSKARRLVANAGVKLIIIDYLQLMHSGKPQSGGFSKVQEVTEISNTLKTLKRTKSRKSRIRNY